MILGEMRGGGQNGRIFESLNSLSRDKTVHRLSREKEYRNGLSRLELACAELPIKN